MEKILTAKEVKSILIRDIPYLAKTQQIWITDTVLSEINPNKVKNISQNIDVKLKRIDGEKWDCDDIAVNGMVEIKKWWKKNYAGSEAVSFGVGYGLRWNGSDENHTANIFIFDDKTFCYDFQLDQCWAADPQNEIIYKVDI